MELLAVGMQKGGIFMWPILAICILAMAICCERLYVIAFRADMDGVAFMAQIQKFVLQDNVDRAIVLCDAQGSAALARVLKAGLTCANGSVQEIQDAVDEATLEVFPTLQKRTSYLPMLANVSTLVGLLGTIQGLIQAFDAVAHASAATKQALLAEGIAVAMYTTFGGLVVAIPTLVLHSFILSRTTKVMDDVDQFSLRAVHLLSARRRAPGPERAVAQV